MRYDHKKGISRRQRDWSMVLVIWGGVLLMGITAFSQVSQWRTERRLNEVTFQVCEWTRTSKDSEMACGLAQDHGKTEYLCNESNSDPLNQCWVENK